MLNNAYIHPQNNLWARFIVGSTNIQLASIITGALAFRGYYAWHLKGNKHHIEVTKSYRRPSPEHRRRYRRCAFPTRLLQWLATDSQALQALLDYIEGELVNCPSPNMARYVPLWRHLVQLEPAQDAILTRRATSDQTWQAPNRFSGVQKPYYVPLKDRSAPQPSIPEVPSTPPGFFTFHEV